MPIPYVNFEGRVAGEPVLRFTKTGTPITTFRAVAAENKQTAGGAWETAAELWLNVVIFKETPEWLVKGAKFHAYGRIETRQYETPAGEKRQTVELKTKFISQNAPSSPAVFVNKKDENDPWETMPKPLDEAGDNVPF